MNSHEIGKGTTRSHRCVDFLPTYNLPHVLVDCGLHKGKARGYFVGVEIAINRGSHDSSHVGILVKPTKKFIMEMRVVWFHLIVENRSASFEKFLLRARLIFDIEINGLFELFRLLKIDDLILSFESFLQKVQSLLDGFVDKSPIEFGMDFVTLHNKLINNKKDIIYDGGWIIFSQ